jgi:Putative prokaryotic signal transducing protein
MKRLFASPDSAEVGFLKNMLHKAGIRCVEINEQMAQTIPSQPFQAELWVENEDDFAEAAALLAEWLNPTHTTGASWICSRCGEKLGSQFSKCWKCGTRRDAVASKS